MEEWLKKAERQGEEQRQQFIATTEFNEEVAQEKPACNKSIYVTLDSGRRIATTEQSNEGAAMDKTGDMKGLSAEPRRIDEKEEYYQYHDNPKKN